MNLKNKILLITRPIAPPWDEASKNFAFHLAKSASDLKFGLLTNGVISDFPKHIIQKPIYTNNDFTYFQKMRLILNLRKLRKDFNILHYIFTPTKQNSFLLKYFIGRIKKEVKIIQTIATLREDLYSDADIKKIIFADLIITYSNYAKNKLEALGFKNTTRIYPGIDLEYYSPRPKDNSMMKRFDLKNDEFIVTFPGEYIRLDATDNITDMILSYTNIWKQKKIKFIFACRLKNGADKKKKEEIIEKMKKNNCLDRAIFTDTLSDMAKLYNLSDIIIFPIKNMRGKFDVPLAVIEPMACEKPIIVSDLPILQEFANAKNSIIIKQGNVEQLKNAITDLYSDPDKRTLIGKNGRKFIEENFDIKKITDIYRKIYATI